MEKNKMMQSSLVKKKIRMTILLGIVLTFLIGCASRKTMVPVPVTVRPAFSDSGQADVPGKWWTVFNDGRLNQLVENALTENFDLKSGWQRLKSAQAAAGGKASALLPDVDASLRGETGRGDSGNYEDIQLGFSSEYELDLWGRMRSSVNASRFQARAGYTDYQTIALMVSAEITRTWYRLVEARSQINLLGAQLDTNKKMLGLIRSRVGSGQVHGVDILRQKNLIAATKEQKITWETNAKLLENQLLVLQGRPPGESVGQIPETLPDLPPFPRTGVPVELVRRRPDVKSAFYRVKAADSQLASAISSLYPRLSISASVSSDGDKSRRLLKDWAHSLVGNLLVPIFNGRRLRAEVRRSRAVKKQRLYEYAQTVLIAFREVEDKLIQEKKQLERLRNLEEQVNLAGKTYQQLRIEYFNGLSDYLDVLTALRDQQQLQRKILSGNLMLLEYRIALYRALAGGFKTVMESENAGK